MRETSLSKIEKMNLSSDDMGKEGTHPTFGTVNLSQLLSTWVVHDLNHIGQVVRILSKQYSEAVGPWKVFLSILTWEP
jgi:hypothetical protein